jgi:hypothetical protein
MEALALITGYQFIHPCETEVVRQSFLLLFHYQLYLSRIRLTKQQISRCAAVAGNTSFQMASPEMTKYPIGNPKPN